MKSTSLSVSSNSYADVNTKAFMVATYVELMVMFEKSEELVGHFQLSSAMVLVMLGPFRSIIVGYPTVELFVAANNANQLILLIQGQHELLNDIHNIEGVC
jgi:hypothetical protein